MSTTSSSSCFSLHNQIHPHKPHDLSFTTSVSMINNTEVSHPFSILHKSNAKYKVTVLMGSSGNFQPPNPGPAKTPVASSGWKKWILGLILTVVLPSFRHKWGPLLALKSNVDNVIETVESVTEIVEEIAEEVEKVAEMVEEKLPEDAKLREAMDSIESLAKTAVKEAQLAQNLIEKVQDVEKDLEDALLEPEMSKTKVVVQQTTNEDIKTSA